jgi:poly(beta-D-mannuronate) lyase
MPELQNRQYTFTIDLSKDNLNWEQVFEGDSDSAGDKQLETYNFTDTDARFIRINVLGNDVNSFASIVETEIYGYAMPVGEQLPPIPTPNPSPQFTYNWFRHGYHVNFSSGDVCSEE